MGAGFETAPRLQHVVAGGTPFGGNRRRRVSNREHRLCVSGRAQGYQLPHRTGTQRHQQRLVDEALFLNRASAQHPPTECRHPPFRLPSPSLPTFLAPCRPHFQLQPVLRSLVLRKTILQLRTGFGRKSTRASSSPGSMGLCPTVAPATPFVQRPSFACRINQLPARKNWPWIPGPARLHR